MSYKIILLSIFLLFSKAFLQPKPIKVYLVGDSIMADKNPGKYPLTGWGQILGQSFNNNIVVINRAADGRTTRSFAAEGRWKAVVDSLAPGDYVLIGFGHNDEKTDLPKIGVQLTDFTGYLTDFIRDVRSKGGYPVLLTPVSRRSFENGTFKDTHASYAAAIKKVGTDQKVPVIDLTEPTSALVKTSGEESSKKFYNWVDSAAAPAYPKGSKDNTHLSITGAKEVVAMVTNALKAQHLPLANYLKSAQ